MRKYSVIDLFEGHGGLSKGFYKQVCNILTYLEINSSDCKLLKTMVLTDDSVKYSKMEK